MLEAVLSVRALKCWAVDAAQRWSVMMTVFGSRPCDRGRVVQNWVKIFAKSDKVDELVREIRGHEQVIEADIVRLRAGMLGVVKTRRCPVWMAIEGLTCITRLHTIKSDGSSELTVLTSGKNSLKKLEKRLGSEGVEVKVLKITPMIESDSVTARQKRVIRLALDKGYFEYPRKIRQRELAAICKASSSTLSEMLRRAERNIIQRYLEQ